MSAVALAVRAAERRRREAYEAHCLMRGFQFEAGRPEGERAFREFFEPFNQGRRREWGGGKNSSTHRINGIFGMQDIDFEESPDFSRAYRLKGPDEAAIRALFAPEIRLFFAATPHQHVAGGGRFLFWWRSGRLPKAEQLDEWLEEGDRVRRRFFKE